MRAHPTRDRFQLIGRTVCPGPAGEPMPGRRAGHQDVKEEGMEQLIEILAERSHIGWMQEKQRQGFADHVWQWRQGAGARGACRPECQIDPDKHHTDMLPYADLPEHVKEYDRVTVRGVLEGIENAGYLVVKAD